LSPLDWPALTAEVEQGAWVRALARYLNGNADNPPELDESRSRFGVWLEAERRNPRSGRATIALMQDLHSKSHHAAQRAVAFKRRGRNAQAAALLAEIQKFGEEMQAHFEVSLHSGIPPAVEHPQLPLRTAGGIGQASHRGSRPRTENHRKLQ
jgi:hypothetical protein